MLKDLENKGVLLTPGEYTSHIADFYSTLVAVLVGLFALLTIANVYTMRSSTKQKIEEIALEVKSNSENIVYNKLNELMNDSIQFNENVVSALYGRIEDEIVTSEKLEQVKTSLDNAQSEIRELQECCGKLKEQLASDENVSPNN